ncbi:proton-coupled folate transporter-like isoform X1 [Bombyx mandarina]|uniref:Proton-coupled folate transporter-like isoform X1 n=1 Tax=Bombyx mandarina TaxID=7092 RepID=A0A6J2JBI5_BOMMA|nr:proton-coupled folate transporter-like isoform X1 [Bombyx mandarina]
MEKAARNETAIKNDNMSSEKEDSPLRTESKIEIQRMNFMEKIRYVKSNITVEPVLAFFVMPSVLGALAIQNLNLDKACRVNLDFGDDACTALRLRKRANYTYEEDEVQKLIASVQAWKSVIHMAVPTLLILFIGAWSDKTGMRKICMLMPILGEFMTCLLNIMNTYLFYQVPVEWTVFMEVILTSCSGGWHTMFLGTYSYLGDITSKETRTFRLGILSLCSTVGFPIGMGLSGVLLKILGYYGVFVISASLQLLNFCYVLFFIEDHTWLADTEKVKKTGCGGCLVEFFDFRSFRETLEITFKKGKNNRRLRMCLILMVVCLNFGPMWGELGITYIFTRYQFNWDEVTYSIFNTYSLVTHSLGTLLSIGIISKKWKADDAVLGIISTSSKICGALVLAFARNGFEAYFAPLVEILNGTSTIALRSIASKLVSHQELGKVFSLFGLAETTMPLIFAPLYTKVYVSTLHVLPGAVFLLSVLFTIPALAIFGCFYHQHRKEKKEKRLNLNSLPATGEECKKSIAEKAKNINIV